MKTKLLIFALVAIFLGACTADKSACGSKNDHKKRVTKTKKLAPNMTM